MNKIFKIIIILLLSHSFVVPLRGETSERIYIATDKSVYISGEDLLISLYCFDLNKEGRPVLSQVSSVAYLELSSNNEVVSTFKIELEKGRGSGVFQLSPGLATGNYVIVAYTSLNKNEISFTPERKTISVYNTINTTRLQDVVVSETPRSSEDPALYFENALLNDKIDIILNGDSFKTSKKFSIDIRNNTSDYLDMNISIYHRDGISIPDNISMRESLDKWSEMRVSDIRFDNSCDIDYEGEVIRVDLNGYEGYEDKIIGKDIVMSVVGANNELFYSTVEADGKARFITGNVHGDRDIIIEILSSDSLNYEVRLNDPFVRYKQNDIPGLTLYSEYEKDLTQKSILMQIRRRLNLSQYDTIPAHSTLFPNYTKEYKLDDYTRFFTMSETITEFVSEIRARRRSNVWSIQVRLGNDYFTDTYSFTGNSALVLIDGVPMFDHDMVINYDPTLIKNMYIYERKFVIYNKVYDGVLDIRSYRGDASHLPMNSNMKVIGFSGVSLKVRSIDHNFFQDKKNPDYRETIYWDPVLNIAPGQSVKFDSLTPMYEGVFTIVIEGVTSAGEPIFYSRDFKVEL